MWKQHVFGSILISYLSSPIRGWSTVTQMFFLELSFGIQNNWYNKPLNILWNISVIQIYTHIHICTNKITSQRYNATPRHFWSKKICMYIYPYVYLYTKNICLFFLHELRQFESPRTVRGISINSSFSTKKSVESFANTLSPLPTSQNGSVQLVWVFGRTT